MNTITYENKHNLAIAESYYDQMLKKNFIAMEEYLHPDVFFISPLTELSGRTAVLEAAKNFSHVLLSIEIRAKFSIENRIMFAYDFTLLEPVNYLRAAVLMEFSNNLISKIELFFDARPFEKKKEDISANK